MNLAQIFNAPMLFLLKRRAASNLKKFETLQKQLWGLCTKTVVLEDMKRRVNPATIHLIAPKLNEDLRQANEDLETTKSLAAKCMVEAMQLNTRIAKMSGVRP